MSRVLDTLNASYTDKVKTEIIDVSKDSATAKKYQVRYVPHLVFLGADGKVLDQQVGFMPLDDVLSVFAKHGVKIEKKKE